MPASSHPVAVRAASLLILTIAFAVWAAANRERPRPAVPVGFPAPPEIALILDRACGDCHSNRTIVPWYGTLPPASWLVAKDVTRGRQAMNFSEWSARSANNPAAAAATLVAACADVQSARMPLRSYRLLHPSSRLSRAEVAAVCEWTTAESRRILVEQRRQRKLPKQISNM